MLVISNDANYNAIGTEKSTSHTEMVYFGVII